MPRDRHSAGGFLRRRFLRGRFLRGCFPGGGLLRSCLPGGRLPARGLLRYLLRGGLLPGCFLLCGLLLRSLFRCSLLRCSLLLFLLPAGHLLDLLLDLVYRLVDAQRMGKVFARRIEIVAHEPEVLAHVDGFLPCLADRLLQVRDLFFKLLAGLIAGGPGELLRLLLHVLAGPLYALIGLLDLAHQAVALPAEPLGRRLRRLAELLLGILQCALLLPDFFDHGRTPSKALAATASIRSSAGMVAACPAAVIRKNRGRTAPPGKSARRAGGAGQA